MFGRVCILTSILFDYELHDFISVSDHNLSRILVFVIKKINPEQLFDCFKNELKDTVIKIKQSLTIQSCLLLNHSRQRFSCALECQVPLLFRASKLKLPFTLSDGLHQTGSLLLKKDCDRSVREYGKVMKLGLFRCNKLVLC